jgi:adenosylcobinamide kinase/adenosylcobinamide-phosphate guanylyltransferase
MTGSHLVIGGAKSGKSLYAEKIISAAPPPYVYIATAEVLDDEMAEKVKRHKERRGNNWITYEEPLKLNELLENLIQTPHPILVDCITLWISNLLIAGKDVEAHVERLCSIISHQRSSPIIFVSNEVGWGIVPDNELARRFRDVAGWTNQKLASVCTHVTWMVAGIPILIKHPQGGMVIYLKTTEQE